MRAADFDFALPPELIAQEPATTRDSGRLLVLHRTENRREHGRFRDLPRWLRPGDVLIFNDSRVIPARLRGVKRDTGGAFEILLLEPVAPLEWWCLAKPGKSLRVGTCLEFVHPTPDRRGDHTPLTAEVVAVNDEGHRRLRFAGTADLLAAAREFGEVPLPPYISRPSSGTAAADRDRYQTVYARTDGSVAAPTAGLHFQAETFAALTAAGVATAYVTLHVGLGTFAPVKVKSVADHVMHEERYRIPAATADLVNRAKREGRRIFAIGTTSARVLESAARANDGRGDGLLTAVADGRTRLFLHPPATFRVIDGLLTNFHLPQSTLLMLVSAFVAPGTSVGRERTLAAYAEAVRERYRFFSYGDAMLIL